MIAALRGRLAVAAGDPLLRNGLYIMATTVVTAGAGFVYWIVAARAMSTEQVGTAAALVSAMLFVALLTNLGFGHVFVSRLADRADGAEWSLTVTTGLLVSGVVSLAVGAAVAVALPSLVPALDDGLAPAALVLFALGVTGAAWSFLIDYACVAERDARPGMVRNAGMAALRLALVPASAVLAVRGSTWVIVTWVVSLAVFDAIGIVRLLPRLGRGYRPTLSGWRAELRAMRGLIAGHHIINVGAQAGPFILPVVVSARLGAADNAYFYTTWMVATALFLVAPSLSNSLFAEGAHRPDRLDEDLRRAARQIALIAGVPAVLLLVGGDLVLSVFGDDYAREGDGLLVALVVAAVFDAGQSLSVAVLRVRHQLRDAAGVTLLAVALAVACTWVLLEPLGVAGAGVGWAAGRAAGMLVGIVCVQRARRRMAPAPTAVME
jgi:O-antigen/teichoic acid export membrane protein